MIFVSFPQQAFKNPNNTRDKHTINYFFVFLKNRLNLTYSKKMKIRKMIEKKLSKEAKEGKERRNWHKDKHSGRQREAAEPLRISKIKGSPKGYVRRDNSRG